MATRGIDELFDNNRLPEGMAGALALCLYFPFGMLIAALRLFIGFHTYLVACLLPKALVLRSVVLRVMCGVLGILITTEGGVNRQRKARVLVANYTSTLDHLATELVIPNILPCVWDLPPALMWLLGYTDMGAKQGRDVLIENAKKHASSQGLPLLVFPEGASTNGRAGLLKFSVWPFSLDQPVQPYTMVASEGIFLKEYQTMRKHFKDHVLVYTNSSNEGNLAEFGVHKILIQLSRPPFAKIAPSVLGGRWWIDVFWFLFVPYTLFKIRLLPLCEREEGEQVEEYTRRVEQLMAQRLGVQCTPHTSADKVEYAKRTLFIQPAAPSRPIEDEDSLLNMMTRQVKEVLPHVPFATIKTHLALTKDVDLTITSILEGRVEFTAEDPGAPEPAPAPITAQPTRGAPAPRMSDTAAKTFAKSTNERHLSLADRKKQLIENARRRYIEKHGLDVQ